MYTLDPSNLDDKRTIDTIREYERMNSLASNNTFPMRTRRYWRLFANALAMTQEVKHHLKGKFNYEN